MGKVAYNERIKLLATYMNNISTGFVLGGAVTPLIVLAPRDVQLSSREGLVAVVGAAVALGLGLMFRHFADYEIQKLQD